MVDVVRKLKEAIILSQLKERPRTSEEIAESMRLAKPNVTKSLSVMKRSGLVKGRGLYTITNKGHAHFRDAFRKINGKSKF